MRERRRIVELWRRGRAVALVSLVRIEGSSYRRVGARLLIAADGEYAGSISGGCLEAEVVRKAQWMSREGAVVKRYSTLFDDTAEIPFGLGCGGTVDLLVEPAGTPEFDALMEALEASLHGAVRRVVTQLPERGLPLMRVVFDGANCDGTSCDAPSSFDERSRFDEWIEVPQRLFVFGAGDDAKPMVQMAAFLGWSVVVVDGRIQWARAERFPEAERVIAASSFAEFEGVSSAGISGLSIGTRDAAVVMTHSYERDRAWLAELMPCGLRYLGLLGARHRSALLVSETAAKLGWSMERACAGLFAPVGLDLGGDGAEAIALAVIAEIQGCCEGGWGEDKLGFSRHLTPEMVAEQIALDGVSRYLQTKCAL